MNQGKLTQQNPETKPFRVFGHCHICLKGKGTASILREVSKDRYEVLTTQNGVPMVFEGENEVLFNSPISSFKATNHKVVALGEIEYFISVEDK